MSRYRPMRPLSTPFQPSIGVQAASKNGWSANDPEAVNDIWSVLT